MGSMLKWFRTALHRINPPAHPPIVKKDRATLTRKEYRRQNTKLVQRSLIASRLVRRPWGFRQEFRRGTLLRGGGVVPGFWGTRFGLYIRTELHHIFENNVRRAHRPHWLAKWKPLLCRKSYWPWAKIKKKSPKTPTTSRKRRNNNRKK